LRKEIKPSVGRLLYTFSLFVALVCLVAVIAYASVRAVLGNLALTTELSTATMTSMQFPVLTLCPLHDEAVLTPFECVLEQGEPEISSCLSTVRNVTVSIEGVNCSCIQYNYPYNVSGVSQSLHAINSASEFGSQTLVNYSLVPPGEPIGVYAMLHAPNMPPTFDFYNGFIASPGYVSLVMIQNWTYFNTSGAANTTFRTSISVSGEQRFPRTGGGTSAPLQNITVDIDIVYPTMTAFYLTEVPVLFKQTWITEAGGLAAVLYFVHGAFMWILTFILSRCCKGEKTHPTSSETELS